MSNSCKAVHAGKSSMLTAFFLLCVSGLFAQATYDAAFQPISFLNANKVHKVGTNGSAAGNVTLYTNVITVGAQPIDCIVRTVSITGGTFTLPGGAAGGTIPFDYSSATGTGMSANDDKFFSPTFNFNAGGGNCQFRFEFILGGSYNNGTNTGTAVNLQNVYLNSYDIDGNGTAGTNQFNEYNGFSSYSLGAGTTLGVSFNATSRLTRFLSSISTNVSVVTDQTTRIRLAFNTISSLDVVVGSQGTGAAYFFLDFSIGAAVWTPTTVLTPVVDLNTGTAGNDNTQSTCTLPASLTNGSTNYTNSGSAINEIRTTFASASITNGNSETLVVNGSTSPANAAIALGFAGAGSSTFTLAGATFKAQTSVSAGVSTIAFTNNAGGTLSTAQTEALIDALQYKHNGVTPTNGTRDFSIVVQDGALLSNATTFSATVSCSTLPVTWLYFNGQLNGTAAELAWGTSYDQDNSYFDVERSTDGTIFKTIGRVTASAQAQLTKEYRFADNSFAGGTLYYRLKQVDKNGSYTYSAVIKINQADAGKIVMLKNRFSDVLQINIPQTNTEAVQAFIYDSNGRLVIRKSLLPGINRISTGTLMAEGIYMVTVRSEKGILYSSRFMK